MPDAQITAPAELAKGRSPKNKGRKIAGFLVGVILLGAAAWSVTRHQGGFSKAMELVAGAPWWALVLALLLPALNIVLAGMTFWIMTPPDEQGRPRVGRFEMLALIASANLGNYLPLRAGMLGRITYHKVVNGIPLAESAKVIAIGLSATFSAVLLMLTAAGLARFAGVSVEGSVVILAAPALALGAAGALSPQGATRRWLLASTCRSLEMGVWIARYAIVFWILGRTLTPIEAAAYMAVAQVVMLIPISGNGLGLREWALGLLGPMLPVALIGVAGPATGVAISADLLNRAGELVISVVCGLLAAGYLARRLAALPTRIE